MIQRILYGITVLLLVIGVGLLVGAIGMVNAQPPAEPTFPQVQPERSFVPSSASAATAPFSAFPRDEERLVSFDLSVDGLSTLTEREQLNQVRDWLLYSIISDAQLSPDAMNRILFDLPPVRYGYLEPVANFQYGDTRTAYLGNGAAVSLIPHTDEQEYSDTVALMGDEIHKNIGSFPETLLVFDYSIDLDNQRAVITRRADVGGDFFTSEESGYVEMPLTSYADLQDFMSSVDRLIWVRLSGTHAVASGRKLQDGTYLNIDAEDVAALWQSESAIKQQAAEFYRGWYDEVDALNRSALANNSRIQVYILPGQTTQYTINRFNTADSFSSLLTQMPRAGTPSPLGNLGTFGIFTQQDYETAWNTLYDQILTARADAGIVDASGFSLDPTFMYSDLLAALKTAEPILEPYITLGELGLIETALAMEDIGPLFGWIDTLQQSAPFCPIELYEFDSLLGASSLAYGDTEYVQTLLTDARGADNCDYALLGNIVFQTAYDYFRFQHARYDGELEGTEVGMVLFYTDLLAKLWAINYEYSSPGEEISDFISLPEADLARIFDAESAVKSATRLWFGHQYEGFQESSSALLFGEVATRIYAASSNPLFPGAESEPSAKSAAFLGWWDNHYAEVARYEPQYERLNEIMKWSLVFAWLSNDDRLASMDFLAPVDVQRDHWFPEWTRENPELRFQDWDSIAFNERGYRGLEVESLPMLTTPPYDGVDGGYWVGGSWSGGVSLADPFIFEQLNPLPLVSADDALGLVLRSNLDYSTVSLFGSAEAFTTLGGTRYQFSALSDIVSVESIPAATAKLRSRYAETINAAVDRTLHADITGMQIDVRVADVLVGQVDLRPTSNGFSVGYEGLTIDNTHQLGLALSERPQAEWSTVLKASSNVQDAVVLDDAVAVRFAGDEQWVEFRPEIPSVDIPPDAEMRISATTFDAQGVEVRMFTPDEARIQFASGQELIGSLDGTAPQAADSIPAFDNPLYNQFNSGDYDGLARMLLASPDQATAFTAYKQDALGYVNDLLTQNHPTEALDMLTHLRRVYGDQPDLVTLEALVKYDLNRLQAAADAVNFSDVPQDFRLTLDDELIARLSAASTPEEQISVTRILEATTNRTEGRMLLYPDGEALNLEYRLDTLPLGDSVSLDAIPADAPVYLADDFNLTTADPSLSVRRILSQPEFGEDLRAYRLTDDSAGAIRPGRLFAEGTDAGYTRVIFDEPIGSRTREWDIDLDFLQDVLEETLGGGGETCSAGMVENNGECTCPQGMIETANTCVPQMDAYIIMRAG